MTRAFPAESSSPARFAVVSWFVTAAAAAAGLLAASPAAAQTLPTFSISSPSVTEGDAGTTATMTFTITLSAASADQVTVEYTTTPSGGARRATSGVDYTAASGTLTFAPNVTSGSFDVSITGDDMDEDNETVFIELRNPSGASVGGGARQLGTGTITDDDDPPTVSIAAPAPVTEGDSGAVRMRFVISLSAASGKRVTVNHGVGSGGTATGGTSGRRDFNSNFSSSTTFPAGQTSRNLDVNVLSDTLDEVDETVVIALTSATNATISSTAGSASGTITDDDTATLSFDGSPTTGEGGELIYSVTLRNFGRTVTVNYADAGTGTATSGSDYTAITAGSSLSFTPPTSGLRVTQRLTVATLDDTKDELAETVIIRLTSTGLTSVDGTGTIQDDDRAPTVGIGSASVSEGDSGNTTVNLPVTLSAASGRTVTVKYADAGTGSATSGTDYQALTAGTLTFAEDETSKNVPVVVIGDTTPEGAESVSVTLSEPSNASIRTANRTGTLTINNDDSSTFSISSASVTEGDTGTADLDYTVTLSPASTLATSVVVRDAGTGTATAGRDYTRFGTSVLQFAAGDTSKTFTVTVTGDNAHESDETVVVALGAVGSVIGTGTGTIDDDDDAPDVTLIADKTTLAENTATVVKATLSAASGEDTTITVSAAAGTGTTASDFSLSANKVLTIAAGRTRSTSGPTSSVVLRAVDDETDAPDKTVTLSGTVANSLGGYSNPASVEVTITDDDPAPVVSLSLSPSVIQERGSQNVATVTATQDRPSSADTTVTVSVAAGTNAVAADFTTSSNKALTIAAGSTSSSGVVTVTAVDNTRDEADKSVTVSGSASNSQGVTDPSDVTLPITDDDGASSLWIDSPSVTEGDSGSVDLTFTVRLSPPRGLAVTVDYEDAGTGTATSGTDYALLSGGTLTFAAGETSKTFAVSVTGDTTDEPDETVVVRLTNAANAGISSTAGTGTGTIVDDDAAGGGGGPSNRRPVFESGVADQKYRVGTPIAPLTLPAARGGDPPLSYALSPSPPVGLTWNAEGRLSGTPRVVQRPVVYTWTATDADGDTAALTFTIEVCPDLRPVFESGVANQKYRVGTPIAPLTLPAATGGDPPLRYALSPSPPAGLTRSAERTLSGTPRVVQRPVLYRWTATDADGDTAALTFTMEVSSDPKPEFEVEGPDLRYRVGRRIDPRALPAAVGGDRPLRYALRPSAPEGVRFAAGTRKLSGTPAREQATTPYTLVATDADGDEATLGLTITVEDPPVVAALEVVSRPAVGDTYGYGERIALEVAFSEPVTVTGTPRLPLTVGARRRAMEFLAAEGSRLRFEYVVVGADRDEDGAGVAANALALDGGAIVDTLATAAELAHERLEDQPGHKVDGSPRAVGNLPPLRLVLGSPAVRVELSEAFVGAETHTAESSASSVASVSVEGTAAVVTALADGTAEVTVWGRNAGGAAAHRFAVTVVTARAEREVVSAALAGLGRSLLASTSATVGRRLEGRGSGGSRMTVAGRTVPLGAGAGGGFGGGQGGGVAALAAAGTPGGGPVTADGLLAGSAFALSFGGGGDGEPGPAAGGPGVRWTVWGAGDVQSFQGAVGSGSTYAGRPAAGWLGADVERGRLLAGVSVARTVAELDYAFTEGVAAGSGTLSARLLAVQPYGRWRLDDRTSVYGVFGTGGGGAELSRSVTAVGERADLGLVLGLAGMRRELGRGGGFDLALRGDVGRVRLATSGGGAVLRGMEASVYRTRVGLEMTRAFGEGLTVTPFAAVNGRFDGGADVTGTGLEVSAGLRLADGSGRVEVDTRGYLLVVHTASGYRSRGASMTARLTPSGDRGLQLALAPRWGASAGGADALWQEQVFSRTPGGGPAASGAVDARVGYGFGLLAPFAETGWAEQESRRLRLGATIGRTGAPIDIEVAGERYETAGASSDLRFSVIGHVAF